MPHPDQNGALERLERRKRVADLYLRGKTQWEIAREVVCSQATVCNDLAAVRKAWLESSVRDFDAARAEQLAKIDRLEQVALAAWERSCLDAETLHVKTETEGKKDEQGRPIPTKTVSEKTTRGQYGDPRFLDRVAWCIEQRCKILGLYEQPEGDRGAAGINVNITVQQRREFFVRLGQALAPYPAARGIAADVLEQMTCEDDARRVVDAGPGEDAARRGPDA